MASGLRWTEEQLKKTLDHFSKGKAEPQAAEPIKQSKYRAIKVVDGEEKFDSKHEYATFQILKLRELAGEVKNIQRQVRFPLFGPDRTWVATYKADFVFWERQGIEWVRVVADAKGQHTRKLNEWQRVKALMASCHGIEVREIVRPISHSQAKGRKKK